MENEVDSMNGRRRVVVTGMGVICPLGNAPDQLWENLSQGRSGVAPFEAIPRDPFPSKCGGEARAFTGDIANFGPLEKTLQRTIKKGLKVMCREIQMGVAAAQLALVDANLAPPQRVSERTGVAFGSDYIMTLPQEFTDGILNCLDAEGKFHFERWGQQGLTKVDPLWLLKYLPNMPASHVAIYNDLRGPSNSITLREASANLSVGEAYETIVRGSADAMVVGATGSRVHPLRSVQVFLQEEVASGDGDPATLSRPFDRGRRGMVLGEGAGVLILEELESAQRRGARILAEVLGHGSSAVGAREGVAHREQAIVNAFTQALRRASLGPEKLGHIHAHGLATRGSDADEARGIRRVVGDQPVPVVAAKSYFGNLGAGSGLVETAASILALQHGRLFPVLNCDELDPECPITPVRSHDVPAGDSFVNLNMTPQGQAGAVVVGRFVA